VLSKAFKPTETFCQREYLQHSKTQHSANPQINELHAKEIQFNVYVWSNGTEKNQHKAIQYIRPFIPLFNYHQSMK